MDFWFKFMSLKKWMLQCAAGRRNFVANDGIYDFNQHYPETMETNIFGEYHPVEGGCGIISIRSF